MTRGGPFRVADSLAPVLAYVTGGSGFVGHWLQAHLTECGDDVHAPLVEITDAWAVRQSLSAVNPDVVFHLAAQAHVGESWTDPIHTFRVNALGTLHVLEAARALTKPPRIIVISSAEVYGNVTPDELPIAESRSARPVSPYGASKVAAVVLSRQALDGSGLEVICTRAFNHIGPGQSDAFVVSGVAHQVALAERRGAEPVVRVGNLSARRDICDVRDVVRAYRLLAASGRPGEVYNVCAGVDRGIDEVVGLLVGLAAVPVRVEVDPARVRAVDIPVLRGDAAKLRADTGWAPTFSLERSLEDVLSEWRSEVARSVADS